jgi:putative membrane protein
LARTKGGNVKLIIRWLIGALALFLAAWIVPGIKVAPNAWWVYAVMAVILGLVNALIRPLLKLLSCGLIILTLGLFTLVINALTLWLSSSLAVHWFHVDFYVRGFWAAFWGALIVSIATVIMSALFRDKERAD